MTVLKNYSALLETLEEVSQGYDEYARRARGQMTLMEKFSTYFGLRLSYTVFGATEQLSRIIQAKQISIQDAVKAAHTAKASYEGMRKEEVYSQFYDQVVEDATGKTEEPVLPRYRRAPNAWMVGHHLPNLVL